MFIKGLFDLPQETAREFMEFLATLEGTPPPIKLPKKGSDLYKRILRYREDESFRAVLPHNILYFLGGLFPWGGS